MQKFVSPYPLPTEHEREILHILIEECSEVIEQVTKVQQRACKLLRFGKEETQPEQPLTNSERLAKELGDLLVMIEMAQDAGLVSASDIAARRERKREKLAIYMQTGPSHDR